MCHLYLNLVYDIDLKLKIDRGAKDNTGKLKKGRNQNIFCP